MSEELPTAGDFVTRLNVESERSTTQGPVLDVAQEIIEALRQREEQVERLTNPDVEKLVYEDGVMEAWLGEAPAVKLIAGSLKKTLDEHEAVNYLELTVSPRDSMEEFKVTVHRPGMKTPHEKRKEAEEERDRLREELERIQKQARRATQGSFRKSCFAIEGWARDALEGREES